MRRVRVHNADPLDIFDLAESTYQSGEGIDFAEVLAVPGRILCDKYDLLDSLFGQISCLFDYRSKTAGPERPAHSWNRAKGTRPVAALGDLYECCVRGGRSQARGVFVIEICG